MEGVITHVIKCSFFDISRGSARSHLVFGKHGGFWTGLMTAKGWCLPCCTNTNSLMNACILCSYTCVGVYCVLKESFLKSALSIQEGTKSSHYWRKRVWHSATKRPVLDVLRLVALFCLTCTSLFQCCSWFFCVLFFLKTQRSDLACSVRLVSPSGDVGLNSRVWSDYVSAVWEIPLGPVGSLHILCWQ